MMSLTYRFIDTGPRCQLEKVIISPGDANMAILNAMAQRPDMQLINPARDFAAKMKSGCYEGFSEEDIAAEAEIANIISGAWHSKPEENIFSILGEMIRLYVNEKQKPDPIDFGPLDFD